MTTSPLSDFTENYASLGKNGEINIFTGGNDFWSLSAEKLNEIGENWLITEFYFEEDWQTWEMHPHGEEIVYLLSGSMDLILEREGISQAIELRSRGLVIIPEGTWHTAKVLEPSNMLVITLGKETKTRPV
ncbi:MAG TPA: cupin domain-containing protein [Pyrinomonadaceae bacterium]|nr:cupin domain-containing protein [Pyrinomonadaceae bacterium]